MKITITGRSGRMGRAVADAVEAEPAATLHATHDAGEDLAAALTGAEAVIDFTLPSLTHDAFEQRAQFAHDPLVHIAGQWCHHVDALPDLVVFVSASAPALFNELLLELRIVNDGDHR